MSTASVHELEYGVSDLIQATALVADGVVALKDGGLLAAWRYAGEDADAQIDALAVGLRDRFAALLNHGRGWVLETNVVRLPSTEYPTWGEFPDPVSRLIEEERRQNYTQPGRYYQTHYYLSLSYFPPSQNAEKVKGYFYESDEAKGWAEMVLEAFQSKVEEFEALCSNFLRMERLKTETRIDAEGNAYECDQLLRYLRLCISGEDRVFLKPNTDLDLDVLLATTDLLTGTKPRQNGRPVRVLALDPMPEVIYAGMLRGIEALPMSFRLHGRSILLDRTDAEALHEANRRKHESKVLPFLNKMFRLPGSINSHAAELAADADIARSLTNKPEECWGLYSARLIVVRDTEEQVEADCQTLKTAIEACHLSCRQETYNINDALCGSWPGHFSYDLRQVPLRGFNIAGMSPLHTTWTGYAYSPCPAPKMPRGSAPLAIATNAGNTVHKHNLHVQDVGHTVFYGPTGTGKTTVYGFHAASVLRYPGAQVVMFDRRKTQYVLCKALGGKFYDFGADRSLTLCPLQHLETEADLSWAAMYIENLCVLNGTPLSSKQRDLIGVALGRFRGREKRERRSLTDFQTAVQDQEIQAALQLYTMGNPISAGLLDAESDSIRDSHFLVFEMHELMQMNASVAIAVLLYLFRRIERKLNPSRITAIFLDEARHMLRHDFFASQLENWLKELRNMNAFIVLALQELEDSQNSKLASVIDQQCHNKIYLPNSEIKNERTRKAYESQGLNEKQIEAIRAGVPKRDYFPLSDGHFSKISFDLEAVALALTASNSDEDRALVDRLEATNPECWVADWLRQKGLPEWADYYKELKKGAERVCEKV